MKRWILALGLAAAFAAGGLFAQGGIGPIAMLPGRVDSNNALVVTAAAAGTTATQGSPIANLPGKVDNNNNLVVAIAGGTATPNTLCLDATNQDVCLERDAANTLAQRRTSNAQTFRLYETFTDANNYARLNLSANSSRFEISTSALGTGNSRNLDIGTNGSSSINFFANGGTKWTIDTSGILKTNSDNSGTIGNNSGTLLRPASLYLATPAITPAASVAAGGTVNNYGDHTRQRYQITIAPAGGDCSTAFIAGSTTADCTIATLPAGMRLMGAFADVTVGFTCSGTCTGTKVMQCGITGAGTEILAAAFNVAATGQAGDADAELGSGLTRAAAIQGGYLPSWSSTTPVVCRFTSGTGNWGSGAATFVNAGSVKITLTTELVK